MTQEDKELLLSDICARIPNHVKVELHGEICTCLGYFDDFVMLTSNTPMGQQTNVANVKPYLRPMSSMTDEEKDYMYRKFGWSYDDGYSWLQIEAWDYLYSIHIDIHGLIEKGLAIEVTEENNPYEK